MAEVGWRCRQDNEQTSSHVEKQGASTKSTELARRLRQTQRLGIQSTRRLKSRDQWGFSDAQVECSFRSNIASTDRLWLACGNLAVTVVLLGSLRYLRVSCRDSGRVFHSTQTHCEEEILSTPASSEELQGKTVSSTRAWVPGMLASTTVLQADRACHQVGWGIVCRNLAQIGTDAAMSGV